MKKENRCNVYLQRLKKRKKEANFRRKVNGHWEKVGEGRKYMCAAGEQACKNTTEMIHDECFDGILLHLNSRSESKSYSSQKRILRRIVEKRQSQSIHRTIGRTFDRFSKHIKTRCISRSVSELHRTQFIA